MQNRVSSKPSQETPTRFVSRTEVHLANAARQLLAVSGHSVVPAGHGVVDWSQK